MNILGRLFGATKTRRYGARGSVLEIARRDEQIISDREAGMDVKELSKKYGVHVQTIYRALKQPERPERPDPNGARNEAITQRYVNGENSQELADDLGISRERVCQVLRRSNVIETRAERRRIAKETIEAEAAALVAAAKAEFEAKLDAAIEMVRNGLSISEAARASGFNGNKMNVLQAACKKAGVESQHSRWRNFGPKIARIRELRAEGNSWAKINQICKHEGHGKTNGSFVQRHLPDLVRSRAQRKEEEGEPPRVLPRVARTKAAPHDPEADWTEDRIRTLLELWFRGCSAAQCADVLGVTRNAIIGKINRLRTAGQLKPPQTSDHD